MIDLFLVRVPNDTGMFGTALRPHQTLPKTSVGYLPSKYPRYTLVRPQNPTEYTTALVDDFNIPHAGRHGRGMNYRVLHPHTIQ